MKRILTLSFILLVSTVNAISQKNANNCPHKELIRDFINLADSLGRFMDNTKAAVPATDWEGFTRALETGEGEKAFIHLGKLNASIKTTLAELVSQLAAQKQKMYSAIKTGEKTIESDVKAIIDQEIYCYFLDTLENNLPKLMAATGKLAPPEIGMFEPCVIEIRSCLAAAAAAHSSGLNNCISAAASGGTLFGWIGGFLFGGACFINVENAFNNAKITCLKNFRDCMGAQ